jgi:hypothetical protein
MTSYGGGEICCPDCIPEAERRNKAMMEDFQFNCYIDISSGCIRRILGR